MVILAVGTHDLPARVPPRDESRLGARKINRSHFAVAHESVEHASSIDIAAGSRPAAVVDAEDHGEGAGAWNVDRGEDAPIFANETVAPEADVAVGASNTMVVAEPGTLVEEDGRAGGRCPRFRHR